MKNWTSKTYSGAVLKVLIKMCPTGGDVEQTAAVQFILQVYLDLVIQNSPSRVQKCLLEKQIKTNKMKLMYCKQLILMYADIN